MDLQTHGRILYVSSADVSKPDGPGVNEREFIASLIKRFGRRVHLLIPKPRGTCHDIDPNLTTFYSNPRGWNVIGRIRQQLQLSANVRTILRHEEFDLVVVRLGAFPFGLLCLCRTKENVAIKTLGSPMRDVFANRGGWKARLAKVLAPLDEYPIRKIARASIAIDCCTGAHMQRHIQRFGLEPGRFRVIENGTNVERFTPQDQSAAKAQIGAERLGPVLGYVGVLPEIRGGMQMVEMVARFAPEYPRLGAVIVGGPTDAIRRRAIELAIADRVILPGTVPYERISHYVNSFDVGFALESTERLKNAGNSFLKVRQYLACGKPVITCTVDDSVLVREKLCVTVLAHDLDSIEAATRELLRQSEHTKQAHSLRAATYARKHLSTATTLDCRIDFWTIQANRRSVALGHCHSYETNRSAA